MSSEKPKVQAWDPKVCKFAVYKMRLRSKVGKAGGLPWQHILDGNHAATEYKACRYDRLGPTEPQNIKDPTAKREAIFNKINRDLYDMIISSLGDYPLERIMANRVEEGNGPAAYEALLRDFGGQAKKSAYPTAKKLLHLRHREFKSVQDYNYEFFSTYESLRACLVADSSEPIKGLPDCILRGLYLDSFDSSFDNLRESIETDDSKKFPDATKIMEVRDKRQPTNSDGTGTANAATGRRGCFNCGGPHDERVCKQPCKICGVADHTRYACPDRKKKPNTRQKPSGRGGRAHSATGGDNISQLKNELSQLRSLIDNLPSTPSTMDTDNKSTGPGRAFYAIARGRGGYQGVVKSWRECSELTSGVRHSVFQKFASLEDAEDFAYGSGTANSARLLSGTALSAQLNPKIDSGADASYWGAQFSGELADRSPATGHVANATGGVSSVIGEGTYKGGIRAKIVDGFAEKLISVASLVSPSQNLIFTSKGCYIADQSTCPTPRFGFVGKRVGNLYEFVPGCSFPPARAYFAGRAPTNLFQKWHCRLGHINIDALCKGIAEKHIVIPGVTPPQLRAAARLMPLCHACGLGKTHRKAVRRVSVSPRASVFGSKVYIDLQEIPASFSGNRYALYCVDDFSRFVWVRFLKYKSQAAEKTADLVRLINSYNPSGGAVVQVLRSDEGGEFSSHWLRSELKSINSSLVHEFATAGRSTYANGVVERMIRTVSEMARTSGIQHSAPPAAFAESLMYATYQHNRLPTKSNPRSTPPIRMAWPSLEPTSLEYFRPFWCPVYIHKLRNEIPRRAKADARAFYGRFVGFTTGVRGYRVLVRGKILNRADVFFSECDVVPSPPPHSRPVPTFSVLDHIPEPLPYPPAPTPPLRPGHSGESPPIASAAPPNRDESPPGHNAIMRPAPPPSRNGLARVSTFPLRERMPRVPFNAGSAFQGRMVDATGYGTAFMANARYSADYNPTSHKDAMTCPDSEHWAEAERQEIANMERHGVFQIVRCGDDSISHGRHVMDTKFVYKIKRNRDGSLDKYKARLCGRGFSQRSGIDYHETYAPVMSSTSLRLILSLAATRGLRTKEFDVSSAFLTATMHEAVYIRAPDCMCLPPGTLLRLRKSLYGCKQSGRNFSVEFSAHLQTLGFTPLSSDPCIFVYNKGDDFAVLGIHVDDGIICCSSAELEVRLVAGLSSKYELGCIRELNQFLGLAVDHSANGSISVHAAKYIGELADRFNMSAARVTRTPAIVGLPLRPAESPEDVLEPDVPYRELVGSLIYLATAVRPDIATATNAVARFMSAPSTSHWRAAKRILAYLVSFPRLGLRFQASASSVPLTVHSDSDWGGVIDARSRRRSMSGYLIHHFGNLIAWKARTQRTPALSVCEAELMAAVDGSKEAMFIRNLCSELGVPIPRFSLLTDSAGAYSIVNKPHYRGRVRHMDLRWNYLRTLVEDDIATVAHTPGRSNPADVLTKPLPGPQFFKLVDGFMFTI